MVAVAQRVPAHVVGDGEHTGRELVDIANQDPRRGIGHEKVLTRIKVDAGAELLRRQGLGLDDVRRRARSWGSPRRATCRRAASPSTEPGKLTRRTWRSPRRPPRSGARRGRDRLLSPGHLPAGPGDGRRDRRGQRGPRLPHAHPPHRRRGPVRGQARRRPRSSRRRRPPAPPPPPPGRDGNATPGRGRPVRSTRGGQRGGTTTTDGIYIDERLVRKATLPPPESARVVLKTRGSTSPCSRWPAADPPRGPRYGRTTWASSRT